MFIVNARLDIQKLLKNLVLSLGTGIAASLLSPNTFSIYQQLQKPFFAPPGFLFPIVWTIFYIFLGTAAYLTETKCCTLCYRNECRKTLSIYYIHLIFNFLWSIIFFTAGSALFAFLDIIAMIITGVIFSIGFAKINKTTLIFTVPYLLWCLFAALLNITMI